jgi:hypothetical protein
MASTGTSTLLIVYERHPGRFPTGGSPRFTGAKEHRHRRQQIDASVALMAVEAYENAKVARWVRRHGLSSRRAETT